MPKREGGNLADLLQGISARAQEAEDERRSLPCWPGLEAKDEERAVDDCEVAGAHSSCRWATASAMCPRQRARETRETVLSNLSSGPIGLRVPEREAELLVKAVLPRRERVPLLRLDSLQVVRGVLSGTRCRVPLADGYEVDAKTGEHRAGAVHLTSGEVLVGLGGNQGRGKTLAACYAIARLGGVYTRAPQWTRRGAIDIDDVVKAPVLVVDQFGREHFGESEWSLSQFEDAIDARYQARRLTFLVGNLTWETFVERLRRTTIADRIGDDGVFVEFAGESIRPGLRAARLKEGA
jgi:hypothetical protein